MQMVGDACYVTAIKPGSDAETKGLKVGDKVISVDGFGPTRETLWKIHYLYYQLRPQPGMQVVVQSPGGQPRQLDILAKIKEGKRVKNLTGSDGGADFWDIIRESESEDRLNRHRYCEMEGDVMIWKMPHFDLSDPEVDRAMDKVRKRQFLILDLRGNPGGAVITLQRLIGHFFDHDIKVADLKGRKEMKPQIAKTRGKNVFTGKLAVLVDSNSGSAAEIFARVAQLEKRGTVLGDRTAGAVMRSRHYSHKVGVDTVVFYGASITDADLIMADGKSLENTGVTPDELLLPTAEDLAGERDPVMARAAELAGLKLSPKKAGSLFPTEWRK